MNTQAQNFENTLNLGNKNYDDNWKKFHFKNFMGLRISSLYQCNVNSMANQRLNLGRFSRQLG